MKLAAIDIGSNSIHLVIVRAAEGQNLEIIDREKEMVRLGAGTLRLHVLPKETMDRAMVALSRYRKMAEANGVERIITTATAAVREAYNADAFIERVRKEVGLEVEVLPGVEEARLIALAVSEVTDFHGKRALIIDIGGGSTEFIITRGSEPELLQSMRLGAVRLTEKFITTDPASKDELQRLSTSIRADLSRVVSEVHQVGFDFAIGTSGTVLNLVRAAIQAHSFGEEDTSGFESFNQSVTLDQLKRLNRRLAKMNLRERAKVQGLEKQRADIIVAGGVLLETILTEVGADSITTCDWSLREGVVLDFLRQIAPVREDAAPVQLLDVRTRSVLSVARRYEYDEKHSHLVARLAQRIFDDTHDLHGMTSQDRKLLEYAALLHDIGYHIAPNNHHRHSVYLIKNSEMPGFTGNEIAVLAAVVRYHRGSMPGKARDNRSRREHEDFRALDRAHRSTVLRLAAILQIADGLDRTHRQSISDVRCEVEGSSVRFIVAATSECDVELWSGDRKADWFREIFRVEVTFEREREAEVPGSKPSVARSLG